MSSSADSRVKPAQHSNAAKVSRRISGRLRQWRTIRSRLSASPRNWPINLCWAHQPRRFASSTSGAKSARSWSSGPPTPTHAAKRSAKAHVPENTDNATAKECTWNTPNENKMSHHWRERAWRRDVRLESWKTWAYAGQWLAPSHG